MVPRMLGWGVQKYANVPAWSNVSERLCPALKIPVSKLPSSAVAECGVGPSLVQVTVSPTLIVTDAGANSKSLIVTPVSAAAVARGASAERRALRLAGTGCPGSCTAVTAGTGVGSGRMVGSGGVGSAGATGSGGGVVSAGAASGGMGSGTVGAGSEGSGTASCGCSAVCGAAGSGTESCEADSGVTRSSAAISAYSDVIPARRVMRASAYLYADALQMVRARR